MQILSEFGIMNGLYLATKMEPAPDLKLLNYSFKKTCFNYLIIMIRMQVHPKGR
jgi:hypothetical protein